MKKSKSWQPLPSHLRYANRVIEALAVLWPTTLADDVKLRERGHIDAPVVLVNIATVKLNRLWEVVFETIQAKGAWSDKHIRTCTIVFWDTVASCYPGNGVYQVSAVWDETVNPPLRHAEVCR